MLPRLSTPSSDGFIRTVRGDIDPSELGVCYAHEHVIIAPGTMTERFPDFLLDSTEKAVAELTRFHADGGRAMVDAMPEGGRDAARLAEVSRLTGVHLVCPTGLHSAKYYPEDHWTARMYVDELTAWFAGEIEVGIAATGHGGAEEEAFEVEARLPRAGVIKIAGEVDGIGGAREYRVFEAAARAHRLTGCPILTHVEEGRGAERQVEFLRGHGVDVSHVVLSHTDRQPDAAAHRQLLASGVNVEFDSAFRWKDRSPNPTLELLLALFDEFPNQLMLGMDAARPSYWKSYGGAPGMSYLLTDFASHLTPAMRHQIFVVNPARAFAFAEPNPL